MSSTNHHKGPSLPPPSPPPPVSTYHPPSHLPQKPPAITKAADSQHKGITENSMNTDTTTICSDAISRSDGVKSFANDDIVLDTSDVTATFDDVPSCSKGVTPTVAGPCHSVDQGWAWVVDAGAFVMLILMMGVQRSYGIFYVEIQERFHVSASTVSLIGGTVSGMFSVGAVMTMTFALNRLSERQCAMIGIFSIATASSLSCFVTSFPVLVFTLGVVPGIGMSMMYGSAFVLLGKYFKRHLTLAQAIANTGVSTGQLLVPYLIRVIIDHFSFPMGLLLVGGLQYNMLVCVSLFRPVDPALLPSSEKGSSSQNSEEDKNDDEDEEFSENGKREKKGTILVNCHTRQSTLEIHDHDNNTEGTPTSQLTPESCYLQVVSPQNEQNHKPGDFLETVLKQRMTFSEENQGIHNNRAQDMCLDCPRHGDSADKTQARPLLCRIREVIPRGDREILSAKDRDIPSSQTFSSTRSLSQSSTATDVACLPLSPLHSGGSRTASLQTLDRAVSESHRLGSSVSLRAKQVSSGTAEKPTGGSPPPLLSLQACKSFPVWGLVLFQAIGLQAGVLCLAFLPPLAREMGLSNEQASLLLTMIGGLDIVSRLLPGVIAHYGILKPHQMVIICLTAQGILCQLLMFFSTYHSMLSFCVMFGLVSGVFYSMTHAIIIQFVGVEGFRVAFGLTLLFNGISGAGAYPLIGALKDLTGTFIVSFHYLGATSLVAAAILSTLPFLCRLQNKLDSREGEGKDGGEKEEQVVVPLTSEQ